jgi:hypothetical protein
MIYVYKDNKFNNLYYATNELSSREIKESNLGFLCKLKDSDFNSDILIYGIWDGKKLKIDEEKKKKDAEIQAIGQGSIEKEKDSESIKK